MKRRMVYSGALMVTIGLAAVGLAATPSGASPPLPVSDTSAVVNDVAGAPALSDVGASGISADLGHGTIHIPTDADAGLALESSDGATVSIGIPGSPRDGVVEGGNMIYGDAADETDVVARRTAEGAQALVVIDGPTAPTRFEFPIEIDGSNARLQHGAGATVKVYRPDSKVPSAIVLPAWATDANGTAVPTRYEINGGTLVQIVEHQAAAYPVVADPNTCGWVTCTYYFGRKATKDIASLPVLAGPVCAAVAFAAPAIGAGCAVYAGAIVYQAQRARNRKGHCLKIKYPRVNAGVPVLVPQIYSGKRCR